VGNGFPRYEGGSNDKGNSEIKVWTLEKRLVSFRFRRIPILLKGQNPIGFNCSFSESLRRDLTPLFQLRAVQAKPMSLLTFVVYLAVGLVAAGFTVALFPPRPGYKPPAHACILALVTCTVFWPMMILMTLGFWTGRLFRRWSGEEPPIRVVRAPRFRYRVLYDEAHARN
jgi:hypothetical protein